MTQHNSFKSSASSSGAKRNVLKRFERVELLKKRGALKGIKRVTKLPKTKPDAYVRVSPFCESPPGPSGRAFCFRSDPNHARLIPAAP